MPMTNVFRVSGLELKMIWRLDTIMKLATNTMMAPITGVGMMESTALSFGENPSKMKARLIRSLSRAFSACRYVTQGPGALPQACHEWALSALTSGLSDKI